MAAQSHFPGRRAIFRGSDRELDALGLRTRQKPLKRDLPPPPFLLNRSGEPNRRKARRGCSPRGGRRGERSEDGGSGTLPAAVGVVQHAVGGRFAPRLRGGRYIPGMTRVRSTRNHRSNDTKTRFFACVHALFLYVSSVSARARARRLRRNPCTARLLRLCTKTTYWGFFRVHWDIFRVSSTANGGVLRY